MAFGTTVAADIINAALSFYVRGKTFKQTVQDRPMLGWLTDNAKTFPSGKDNVDSPVQLAFMGDTAGFLQGYNEDDTFLFNQASNIKRAFYPWKELHAGLVITWTELKKDGITINDDAKVSEHSQRELTVLTGLLDNRLEDFSESYARTMNAMLWADGSASAKHIPGIQAILTNTPAIGVTGGLDRATYPAWRHRSTLNVAASASSQTLTKFLRSEVRQLRRFGGKPNKLAAGSKFIEALEVEVTEKGVYTMEGFTQGNKTDIGVANIRMKGVGEFEYDPTMDDIGLANYAFFLDGSKLRLRPMEGEANKILKPTRPYQYAVFLRSMTYTGALECIQLNAQGVYSTPLV